MSEETTIANTSDEEFTSVRLELTATLNTDLSKSDAGALIDRWIPSASAVKQWRRYSPREDTEIDSRSSDPPTAELTRCWTTMHIIHYFASHKALSYVQKNLEISTHGVHQRLENVSVLIAAHSNPHDTQLIWPEWDLWKTLRSMSRDHSLRLLSWITAPPRAMPLLTYESGLERLALCCLVSSPDFFLDIFQYNPHLEELELEITGKWKATEPIFEGKVELKQLVRLDLNLENLRAANDYVFTRLKFPALKHLTVKGPAQLRFSSLRRLLKLEEQLSLLSFDYSSIVDDEFSRTERRLFFKTGRMQVGLVFNG